MKISLKNHGTVPERVKKEFKSQLWLLVGAISAYMILIGTLTWIETF